MALNVNRAITDPFYRYKMPKLLAKVEGRGNGIRTVIANMTEIAKSLERPPMYPTKYFGCELGAQTNFDAKNERYIVNGDHDANKLQDVLDGFIKKFVLCPACDNPETALSVRRNQIHSKCKACGHQFVIDNKHKLAAYILKNPPKKEIDFSKAKENNHKQEEDADATIDKLSNDDDDDDDWAPEPVENDKLAAAIGKLVIDKDLEKSLDERLEMIEQFILKAKKEDTLKDGKELADEAERLDVKQKVPLVLAMTALDENIKKEHQLENLRRVFLRFTLNDKKAQRYLLGGIEKLIMAHESQLMQFAPHIIKALYDNDIVEEEAILAWGEKPSSKYVSKSNSKKIIDKCEPVINWLKTADTEEESEEEEASDDEVDFDDRAKHTRQVQPTVQKEVAPVSIKDTDGAEINIDDI